MKGVFFWKKKNEHLLEVVCHICNGTYHMWLAPLWPLSYIMIIIILVVYALLYLAYHKIHLKIFMTLNIYVIHSYNHLPLVLVVATLLASFSFHSHIYLYVYNILHIHMCRLVSSTLTVMNHDHYLQHMHWYWTLLARKTVSSP